MKGRILKQPKATPSSNPTTMPDEPYETGDTLLDSEGTSAEPLDSMNDDRREDDNQVDYYEDDDRDHQL
jgi:hypothetical protein